MANYMMNRLNRLPFGKLQAGLLIQSYGRGCSLLPNTHFKEVMKEKGVFRCTVNSYYVNVSCNSFRRRPSYIPDIFPRRHTQASRPADNNSCWNCHNILKLDSNKLFCDSCNSLQPVNKQVDLFIIMGIKRSYSLNLSELKQKFHNLQTLLHPDKFSSKPKKEQEFSEEFSSIVNKAYTTLLDPLERGLYLLSLNSISIEEGSTDVVDKLFLMEIMERNEEIENESDAQKLNELYNINRKQLDLLIGKVTQAFENKDLDLARKLLTEMKYYNTIETKIMDIKQKLNIPG